MALSADSDGPGAGCENVKNGGAAAGGAAPAAETQRVNLTPAQQALASEHIGLVGLHLRKRVPTPREPTRDREYDDLFQEGCVALVRAAARYQPKRDGSFPAYALPRIRGGIFAALHECFSTIRVPLRAAARARSRKEPVHATQRPVHTLDEKLTLEAPPTVAADVEPGADTIRHVIRRRFEQAVRDGLAELQGRSWTRRNPCAIMKRLAAERLLIPDESERTPLRQIAREAGVSSSRASAYEQHLIATIGRHFALDPQLQMLVEFAQHDPAGFDGLVDEGRREILSRTQLKAFENQFEQLEPPARAELIYRLIERSGAVIPEIARNLYRLTLSDSDEPLPLAG